MQNSKTQHCFLRSSSVILGKQTKSQAQKLTFRWPCMCMWRRGLTAVFIGKRSRRNEETSKAKELSISVNLHPPQGHFRSNTILNAPLSVLRGLRFFFFKK